jgi:hypothetical protein
MTRGEMIERTPSLELSHWFALFLVHAEEREHARHIADSGDGIVYEYGRKDDEPDDDGDDQGPD